jgi:hypothetical protein
MKGGSWGGRLSLAWMENGIPSVNTAVLWLVGQSVSMCELWWEVWVGCLTAVCFFFLLSLHGYVEDDKMMDEMGQADEKVVYTVVQLWMGGYGM